MVIANPDVARDYNIPVIRTQVSINLNTTRMSCDFKRNKASVIQIRNPV